MLLITNILSLSFHLFTYLTNKILIESLVYSTPDPVPDRLMTAAREAGWGEDKPLNKQRRPFQRLPSAVNKRKWGNVKINPIPLKKSVRYHASFSWEFK